MNAPGPGWQHHPPVVRWESQLCPGGALVNGDENGDFTRKNGDFTRKNGDFTSKNGDFTSKNGDLSVI